MRTVAQHIWAAASHTLQYKQEQSVPMPVRRSISRVSALLETVDLELERVLREREDYRSSLKATPAEKIAEDFSKELDVDLLQRILADSFPAENKGDDERYGELLRELTHVGIRTAGELQEVIKKHRAEVMVEEKEHVERSRERAKEDKYIGTSEERVNRGVFFTHVGLARQLLREAAGADAE